MSSTQKFYRQIQDIIEERLSTYFPEHQEWESRLRITLQKPPGSLSNQTLILNLVNEDKETIKRIFAKIPANHPVNPSREYQYRQAKREYDALQLLWSNFTPSPRLRIPRPLDFIPPGLAGRDDGAGAGLRGSEA